MAHIAFITGAFTPDTDANITCVSNVIRQLVAEGHSVSCVCGTAGEKKQDIVGDVNVYRVHNVSYEERQNTRNGRARKAWGKLFHYLHSIFVLPFFPDTNLSFTRKLYKQIETLNKLKKVDCIVGVFRPFSSVKAMILFKKKHPGTVAVGYYLDVLKGAVKPAGIPGGYYYNLCDRREKRIFNKMDVVLMAERGREFYENNPDFQKSNIEYVNFPTLVLRPAPKACAECDGKTKLVYAGYMDKDYRNPACVIDAVALANRLLPETELHLYGTSNMESELASQVKKHEGSVFYHGKVDKKTADDAIDSASCLINIGNNIPGIVPSKIFELFSSKKKIIHFTDGASDSALQYFEKYPLALILKKDESAEINAEKITEFLGREITEPTDEFLTEKFYSAMPVAVTKIINKVLN